MSDNVVKDRRVREVLKLLKDGYSRKEVSKEYDYSSYRSLDQYMRRRGFHWSSDNDIYEPVESDDSEENSEEEMKQKSSKSITDGKILRILAKFDTEYPDPKKIAQEMNFDDYDALTKYMTSKNYRWDSEKKNYVKCDRATQSNADVGVDVDVDVDMDENDIDEFLEYLYDNRTILKRVIATNLRGDDLPNYLISGDVNTKTIYMSTDLSRLMKSYSDEKNISQRQIVESALIEFFKNYGYNKEIEYLLKS